MDLKLMDRILVADFGLNEQQVAEARCIQAEKGGHVGDILVKQKNITEARLLKALSVQYAMDYWPRLPLNNMDSGVADRVPIQFLKKYFLVPLQYRQPVLAADCGLAAPDGTGGSEPIAGPGTVIAINNPSNFQALDDLVRIMGLADFKTVLSSREAILAAINLQYDLNRDSAEQLVQDMEENGSDILSEIEETADLLDDTSEAPIIKLVNHIISQSIKARASDIHIEPYQHSFTVRYRVDGILYDLLSPPKWIQPTLTSRIKVMAKMDIAEKRLPQDGRFEVRVGDQNIDLRVSTIPTASAGHRPESQSAGADQKAGGHTPRDHPGDRAHRQRKNHDPVCHFAVHQQAGHQHYHHRGSG